MSIHLMDRVWRHFDGSRGKLLIMLALADWGNDDGTNIFPSLEKLGEKARLTKRQVQNVLNTLESDGWISRVRGGGRGRRNQYTIHVSRLKKGGNNNHETLKHIDGEKGKLATRKGEISNTKNGCYKDRTVREPSSSGKPEREALFDVCGEVFFGGTVPPSEASHIGKTVKDLIALGASPDDVRQRHANALVLFDGKCGPEGLIRNWATLAKRPMSKHEQEMERVYAESRANRCSEADAIAMLRAGREELGE